MNEYPNMKNSKFLELEDIFLEKSPGEQNKKE